MTAKTLNIYILSVLRKRLEDDIVVLTTVVQEKSGNIMVNGILKSLVLVKYRLLEQLPFDELESTRQFPVSGEKVLLKGYSSKYNLFLDDFDMLTDILRDTEKNQMNYILKSGQESEIESGTKDIFQKIVQVYKNVGKQLDEIRKTKEILPHKLSLFN